MHLILTGPDGIRDHQASVLDPNTYVGIGTMSPEGTSDLNYLWRPSRVQFIILIYSIVLRHL